MYRTLSRREFLRRLGIGAGAGLTCALVPTMTALAQADAATTAATTALSEAERALPLVDRMRADLEPLMAGREMGLDFRRFDNNGDLVFQIQINADEIYPVASAFKAWAVLYYFMSVPIDSWDSSPNSTVYRVAVFSNNSETGKLLYEVADFVEGDKNAIEKYNDFLLDTLGLDWGLFTWNWQGSPTAGLWDPRFDPAASNRNVAVGELLEPIGNVSTAADLADGYDFIIHAESHRLWAESEQFRLAVAATIELLAIAAPGYRSPIERVLYSGYIGKDGTLPLGDIDLGRVINDAGIVGVATGEFVISFMSAGETEHTTEPVLQHVIDNMRMYEAAMHPSGQEYVEGESHPLYWGRYNYGFVRHQTLDLFSAPNENAARVDNPVRRNTIFALMYLMQGALVRFVPVNDEWGRIVRDDDEDATFSFDDWTFGFAEANWSVTRPDHVYVRIADLLVVGYEKSRPIGYVSGAPAGTSKFFILDVPRREITFFEGATPILKSPVVLNLEETPRGHFYIHRVFLTRNMPNYPGVPYSNFLHDGQDLHNIGYAVHGAPWHRWSETVTKRETVRRYSHGCINLPNWRQPVGDWNLPVDEFVFRWMGGFPRPGRDRFYLPKSDVVRAFIHNNPYADVFKYNPPDSLRRTGEDWDDILGRMEGLRLQAPDTFFEPSLL